MTLEMGLVPAWLPMRSRAGEEKNAALLAISQALIEQGEILPPTGRTLPTPEAGLSRP